MVCIYCLHETHVTNSRLQKRTNNIWRRRACLACSATFTTLESVKLDNSVLISHKTTIEPLQRDKLFLSIHDSLKHRKTAVADATALTDTILSKVLPSIEAATINSSVISLAAMKVLQQFDKTAATHYKAFYC